eukprot:5948857-Pleurochrysis_carterae.AAC.3
MRPASLLARDLRVWSRACSVSASSARAERRVRQSACAAFVNSHASTAPLGATKTPCGSQVHSGLPYGPARAATGTKLFEPFIRRSLSHRQSLSALRLWRCELAPFKVRLVLQSCECEPCFRDLLASNSAE